jgi:hypothetical protein
VRGVTAVRPWQCMVGENASPNEPCLPCRYDNNARSVHGRLWYQSPIAWPKSELEACLVTIEGDKSMPANAIVWGVLSALIIFPQVSAAEQNVCLQRNRFQSWRAIDENTLAMVDRSKKVYRVSLRDACPTATETTATLVFGSAWRNLQCLGPGLAINVSVPGRGLRTCRVASVTAG